MVGSGGCKSMDAGMLASECWDGVCGSECFDCEYPIADIPANAGAADDMAGWSLRLAAEVPDDL